MENGKGVEKGNEAYETDSYGQEWVLKDEAIKVMGFETGLVGKKVWYRVSDLDENKMFWLTSILGALGIHKLLTGNIRAFIEYLLTCGGFGVFTVLDVLQFLTGSAGFDEVTYFEDENARLKKNKERVFLRPLQNRWIVPVGVICAAAVTFILLTFLYKPIMVGALECMTGAAGSLDQEVVTDNLKIAEEILDFGFDF